MALYELSKESSDLNKVEDGMRGLSNLLNENSEFMEMIVSPTITKENKQNVLLEIADQKSNAFKKCIIKDQKQVIDIKLY